MLKQQRADVHLSTFYRGCVVIQNHFVVVILRVSADQTDDTIASGTPSKDLHEDAAVCAWTNSSQRKASCLRNLINSNHTKHK